MRGRLRARKWFLTPFLPRKIPPRAANKQNVRVSFPLGYGHLPVFCCFRMLE